MQELGIIFLKFLVVLAAVELYLFEGLRNRNLELRLDSIFDPEVLRNGAELFKFLGDQAPLRIYISKIRLQNKKKLLQIFEALDC